MSEANHDKDEQIEFSELMIEQWSNFIKTGRPNSKKFGNQWRPTVDIVNGLIMHYRTNDSGMRKFKISPTVQFWMNTCASIETPKNINLNDEASNDDVSFTILIFASLLVLFI